MWTTTHGQILTLDNFMLRGCHLANRCCICYCNAEFVDHLLLLCPIAHSLQMYMLWLFGIDWVMLGSVVDLLFCWYRWLRKHSSDIWNLVPGCLMWTIWTEWNWRYFEDEGKTVVQLLEFCQRTLFDWFRCWGFSDCSTLWIFFRLLEQTRGYFCLFVPFFPLLIQIFIYCFSNRFQDPFSL